MFSDVTDLQQRDHRLSTEGKIVSKYCNISKFQERGCINGGGGGGGGFQHRPPPPHPTPLYQGGVGLWV